MKNWRLLASTGLGVLLTVGGAYGQGTMQRERTETQTGYSQTSTSTSEIHRATSVIGDTVTLEGGTSYGKIEDFVLSPDGCVEYAVLVDQDTYYVIPWNVVTVNYGTRTVRVDVTKDLLQRVAFSKTDWQRLSTDSRALHKVHDVFAGRSGHGRSDYGQEGSSRRHSEQTPSEGTTDRTQRYDRDGRTGAGGYQDRGTGTTGSRDLNDRAGSGTTEQGRSSMYPPDRGDLNRSQRQGTQDRGTQDRGTYDRGTLDRGTNDRGTLDRGTQNRGTQGTQDRQGSGTESQRPPSQSPPSNKPPRP